MKYGKKGEKSYCDMSAEKRRAKSPKETMNSSFNKAGMND